MVHCMAPNKTVFITTMQKRILFNKFQNTLANLLMHWPGVAGRHLDLQCILLLVQKALVIFIEILLLLRFVCEIYHRAPVGHHNLWTSALYSWRLELHFSKS